MLTPARVNFRIHRLAKFRPAKCAITVAITVPDFNCSHDRFMAIKVTVTLIIDFMTARWADLPYAFLDHVSRRIMNEIEDIARGLRHFGQATGNHRVGIVFLV
jgi:hypothetical protein